MMAKTGRVTPRDPGCATATKSPTSITENGSANETTRVETPKKVKLESYKLIKYLGRLRNANLSVSYSSIIILRTSQERESIRFDRFF